MPNMLNPVNNAKIDAALPLLLVIRNRTGKQADVYKRQGLENVRHTVEKYHGALNIETKDGIFSVTAVFPGE